MKTSRFLSAVMFFVALSFGFVSCDINKGNEPNDPNDNGEESPITDIYNGYAYVDLGLSVKWATCNVGADSPEEYGDYFAWGEVEPKEDYSWSTYKWCENKKVNENNNWPLDYTKYCTESDCGIVDNKVVLDKEDDAAAVNMGGVWRMPTYDEQLELKEGCIITTTENYNGTGVAGVILTSKINGNYIFLPAAGERSGTGYSSQGYYAIYWSSSLNGTSYAESLGMSVYNEPFSKLYLGRGIGQPVRGVCE